MRNHLANICVMLLLVVSTHHAAAQLFLPPDPSPVGVLTHFRNRVSGGYYLPLQQLLPSQPPFPPEITAIYTTVKTAVNPPDTTPEGARRREEQVVQLLHHRRPRTRAITAVLLVRGPITGRIETALVSLLSDRDPLVRMSAILSLMYYRSTDHWPQFTARLADRDARVRIAALVALGGYDDPQLVPTLCKLLAHDPETRVRQTAATILGTFHTDQAFTALREGTHAENLAVRLTAISALAQRLPRLPEPDVPAPVIIYPGPPPGPEPGQAPAVEEEHDNRDRWAGQARHASYTGRQIRDIARLLVQEPAPAVRVEAVYALQRSHRESAVTALIGALRDENAEVRGWAAQALGDSHDPAAVQPLTALLMDEHEVFSIESYSGIAPFAVCDLAARALGELRDPRALPALFAALTRDHRSRLLNGNLIDALTQITGQEGFDDRQPWIDWWNTQQAAK
ncbi:MAG: HEAT repeat domain-containing protein [Armatimonadota bacterium]